MAANRQKGLVIGAAGVVVLLVAGWMLVVRHGVGDVLSAFMLAMIGVLLLIVGGGVWREPADG